MTVCSALSDADVTGNACSLKAITTDGEVAIRTGLNKSKLTPSTVQIEGSIHLKWAITAHKVGPGNTQFGKEAGEMWSAKMQFADGPLGFQQGGKDMLSKYQDDPHRLKYVQDLIASPQKAHFMREHLFTNACLTDMTEGLFSATKQWQTAANGQTSSTLLQSVSSLATGCRDLAARPYLKPKTRRSNSLWASIKSHGSECSIRLFHALWAATTHAACTSMFADFKSNRDRYFISERPHSADGTAYVVQCKHGKDRHIIGSGVWYR